MITDAINNFATFYQGPSQTPPWMQGASVLLFATGITLYRFAVGLISGTLIGLTSGLLLSYWAFGRLSSEIVASVTRGVPLLALIPLFIFWAPNEQIALYFYISFAVATIVMVNTYDSLKMIPSRIEEMSRLANITFFSFVKNVAFPSAIDNFLSSIKTVTGYCWAFTLGAEFLASSNYGLGYLLIRSREHSNLLNLLVLFVLFVFLALVPKLAIFLVSRKLKRHGLPPKST